MAGSSASRRLLTERFLLTYGDGLSDVPIDAVVAYHEAVGALATVTAVHPPPRFGSLGVEDGSVDDFREKPRDSHDWINGGYFVVEPEVLDLIAGDDVPFEAAPLATLGAAGPARRPTSTRASGCRWTPSASATSSTGSGSRGTHRGASDERTS